MQEVDPNNLMNLMAVLAVGIAFIGSMLGLFLWNRAEGRTDIREVRGEIREMKTEFTSFREMWAAESAKFRADWAAESAKFRADWAAESAAFHKEWAQESKDFHGRLYALEKRRK